MSKIYTDLNTVLTPYATAIKKNASDITSLNGSLDDSFELENSILDITTKRQYFNKSAWIDSAYYSKSGNSIVINNDEGFKRYPKISGLKSGVYSFYNIARGYTIIQYISDGSLHSLSDLGATTTRGTISVAEDFNLYASAATSDNQMWVNDTSYPTAYIEGYYDYASRRLGKIEEDINIAVNKVDSISYGYTSKNQYLKADNIIENGYWAINSSTGALQFFDNTGFRAYKKISGLKAGTYAFTRLSLGFTIFEYADGSLHKLNEFSGIVSKGGIITVPQDFSIYASAATGYAYAETMFVNDIGVPESYVEGTYDNPFINVNYLMESDPTILYQDNTVKTVAHRGDFLIAPQCTRASYIIARKRGITIAENDLNITSDGQYVMYHGATLDVLGDLVDLNGYLVYTDGTNIFFYDSANSTLYDYSYIVSTVDVSTLTRCNGRNYNISESTFEFLRKLSFGAYKGAEYLSQTILTFAEWVLLCKQLGMDIYIDRKIAYTNEIIDDLFGIVRRYGMLDNATWFGFTVAQAEYLRTKDKNARFIKLITTVDNSMLTEWEQLNQSGRGVVFEFDGKTVTENDVQAVLTAGYGAEAYYVDVTSQTEAVVLQVIRTLVGYGIQGLALDHYRVCDAFKYILYEF